MTLLRPPAYRYCARCHDFRHGCVVVALVDSPRGLAGGTVFACPDHVSTFPPLTDAPVTLSPCDPCTA